MKKVLYGVALTLFAGVSVGSLQSCKDDVNDLATQTSFNLSNLQSQIDWLKGEAARLQNEKANATDLELYAKLATVNALADRVAALEGKPSGSNYDDTDLRNLIGQLNGAITSLQGDLAGLQGALAGKVDATELATQLANLKTELQGEQTTLKSELEGYILANKNAIEALDTYVKENYYNKDQIDSEFEQVYLQLEEAKEMISQVLNTLQDQIDEVDEKVNDLIDYVDSAIKSIVNQLDKKVTGILIQGVNSPVFGDFRTPLGIKSNILFNWYGYNSFNKAITFPSADVVPAALAHDTWSAPVGYYGDDADNNVTLGKVYVTVNPVGTNFDNLELFIENSAGARLPYSVTLTPSDEVLYHGYTRTEENGFYEGEVKMLPNDENVAQIKVSIEEDLKTSMKDVLKDPSKTTAKALVKAVLEQLQGKIPAYGLRYDWTVGEVPSLEESMDPSFSVKSNAVLSQYDLAIATAHPLSYNFLAGYPGTSHKLPELGHMQNLINKIKEEGGKLKFNLGGSFKIEDVTIDLGDIELEGVDTNVQVNLEGAYVEIDDEQYKLQLPDDFGVTGLDTFQSSLETALQEAFSKVAGKLNTQINTEIIGKINEQITKMFDDINKEINGKIDDMINSATSKLRPYFGKIDKAIDLYNNIANKVNNFLDDPNAYLQVTALYNMGGANYGMVSGKLSDPTPFVQAGGDSFKIYLTSYTGELIVPACKKYVAVTGVYKKNGKTVTAVENADLAALNSGDLNKVLSGNQIEVLVKALPAGNVYEFTYQAIDYSGYTSTKKFYIEVK